MSRPRILAFNDPWHDSSFCMVDGDGLTHIECERFTRVKYDTVNPILVFCEMFPHRIHEFSTVVIEESNHALGSLASFVRRVIAARAEGASDPSSLLPFMPYGPDDSCEFQPCPPVYEDTPQVKEFIGHLLRPEVDIFFCGHHAAHAANAYYSSGFDAALTVTLDGIGTDYALGPDRRTLTMSAETGRTLPISGSVFECEGRRCEPLHQVTDISFGYAWSRVTGDILGLAEGEEGTVMAMAALGDSRRFREDVCEPWIWLPTPFGLLESSLQAGLTSFTSRLRDRLTSDQDRFDVAAALQETTEERFKLILDRFITPAQRDLCLAGGSILNCQMVGKIIEWFPHVRRVFVPPAPYDGGICVGAAQRVLHQVFGLGNPWETSLAPFAMGAPYSRLSIVAACRSAKVTMLGATPRDICVLLQQGKVVGWFSGAAESGRRALGHRSILADPRIAGIKERLNAQIKHRQWFRPFAPMILSEKVADWFDCAADFRSPYMSFAVPVRPHCREQVPAIVHIDGSARVQTVHRELSPAIHLLLNEWQTLSGIPLLLNTSFNDREPIVETPADALNTMARARLDGVYFADAGILAMPAALGAESEAARQRQSLRLAGGNEARLRRLLDVPDGVRIDVITIRSELPFDTQMNCSRFEVQEHRRYTLEFLARSDFPRLIDVGVAHGILPWTNLGLFARVTLSQQWQRFVRTFLARESASNVRVHFDVGNSDVSVEVRGIRLSELADGHEREPMSERECN